MKSLLAGVFFSTAVVGFAGDPVQLNVQPLGRGFFWPAFFGAGAVVGLVATIKRLRSPILIFIVVCWIGGGLAGLGWLGLGWFTHIISLLATPWPMPQALKARIVFDAIGITISRGLGLSNHSKAANDYHLKTGQREMAGTFIVLRVNTCLGKFNLYRAARMFAFLVGPSDDLA